jgi:hypothetical protein
MRDWRWYGRETVRLTYILAAVWMVAKVTGFLS